MISYDSVAQEIYNALINKNLSIIVSCTKLKIWDKIFDAPDEIEAQDVYKGPLFIQFLNFKKICDNYNIEFPWKILSAKYGLIYPYTKIKNYNVSFASKYNFKENNFIKNYEILNMMKHTFSQNGDFRKTKVLLIWAGKEYVDRILNSVENLQRDRQICEDMHMLYPVYKAKIGDSLHIMKEINYIVKEKMRCLSE